MAFSGDTKKVSNKKTRCSLLCAGGWSLPVWCVRRYLGREKRRSCVLLGVWLSWRPHCAKWICTGKVSLKSSDNRGLQPQHLQIGHTYVVLFTFVFVTLEAPKYWHSVRWLLQPNCAKWACPGRTFPSWTMHKRSANSKARFRSSSLRLGFN